MAKIQTVYYSSGFKKSLARFSDNEKKRIRRKIELFLSDPFVSSLRTHKLKGKKFPYWSFSIDYHMRVLFEFQSETSVGLIDIGTHEIYK